MMYRTRGLTTMAAGLLLLTLGGLGPQGDVTSSNAAGTSAGTTSTQTLQALACPGAAICYAVGGRGTILATHDAGATWQRQTSGTKENLIAVDCPTVSACFVSVEVPCNASTRSPLLVTTDGGSTWTKKRLPPGCSGPGPDCPTVTTCYVRVGLPLSGEFFRTTDGGRSWQARGAIGNALGPVGATTVKCPSATVCYAGGKQGIGRSTDGARTWQISHFSLKGSWCTSEIVCLEFHSIACPSEGVCYAAGCCGERGGASNLITTTKDGGRTWRRSLISISRAYVGVIGALSCPTSTVCFAVGAYFIKGNGTVARSIATTVDGGDHWQIRSVTRGPYPFDALACPSASVCYVLGYLGRLMGSVDGGLTWRDLIPALFVSGTYRAKQPLHTYSRWFTATQPWQVKLGMYASNPPVCEGLTGITVYVQNTAKTRVAGPIHTPTWGNFQYTRTVKVTGRLRLDVVTPHCSNFSVRVDGVTGAPGSLSRRR